MRPHRLEPQQALSLVGLLAAMFIAVVANVLGARHFKRWDWTSSRRYTLSAATLATLHDLPEPVDLFIMIGKSDPLGQNINQLILAYTAETAKLRVHSIDPDRDTLALEEVRKRFRIDTGRTADGHVVTDAVAVVSRGDKFWFLSPSDLFELSGADETKVEPREEHALTAAIRNVVGGDKSRICFTTGHGELSLADGSDQGLGFLKDLLEKDNYQAESIDSAVPNEQAPFHDCVVVVTASPRGGFTDGEAEKLRAFLLDGGNLLFAASPIADEKGSLIPLGVDRALSPFGIALDDNVVFELDPKLAIPDAHGLRFLVTPKLHPISAGLVSSDGREPPRIVVNFARSLHSISPQGSASAIEILSSSAGSFAIAHISESDAWTDAPEKKAEDPSGPLTLAMASERPKLSPSAQHGPRVVVFGTASVMLAPNWRETLPFRGAALLVESAISWLASKPVILDIPAKPPVAAGIRITDASRFEVRRYVLIYMPLAAALLGIAVALRRKSTEGAPRKRSTPEPANAQEEDHDSR